MNRPKPLPVLAMPHLAQRLVSTLVAAILIACPLAVATAQTTPESYPAVPAAQPPTAPPTTARVAVLPVVLMHPPGKTSAALAAGFEELLRFYLDAYFAMEVIPADEVRVALTPYDLSGGPGLEVVQAVAGDLQADYVIGTTLRFGQPARLSAFWYNHATRGWEHPLTAEFVPFTTLPVMNRFAKQLAFAPTEQFARASETERQLSDREFCKFLPSFVPFAKGSVALWRGDFTAARTSIREALTREQNVFPRAFARLAEIELAQMNADANAVTVESLTQARNQLVQALADSPNDYQLFFAKARLSFALATKDAAQAAKWLGESDAELRQVLTLRNNWLPAWKMLLTQVKPALIELGAADKTVAQQTLIDVAMRLRDGLRGSLTATMMFAKLLHKSGAVKEAMDELRGQFNRSPSAGLLYGRWLEEAGDVNGALSVYQTLAFRWPALAKARSRIVALSIQKIYSSMASGADGIAVESLAGMAPFASAVASVDRDGNGKINLDEFTQLLPAAGRGRLARMQGTPANDGFAELHFRADGIWEHALAAASLGDQGESFVAVETFLNSPIAIARYSKMRESVDGYIENMLGKPNPPALRALTDQLLAGLYLARVDSDENAARMRARQLLMGARVASNPIALYLFPERAPATRFAPKIADLPDDNAFNDEGERPH